MNKDNLHSIAEKQLAKEEILNDEKLEKLSLQEVNLIVHRLRVHQIELEMQNEELKRIQEELDDAKARYFDLYDLAPEGYLVVSEKGLILEANLTAANMLGYARGNLIKQRLSQYIYIDDQDSYYIHRKKLFEFMTSQECELRMIRCDGTTFWGHMKTTAVVTEGISTLRLILSDVDDRVKRVEQINYLNYHDQLTGIYNRRFYEEELNRLDIEKNLPLTLVMGDLNGLKLINDSFGHQTGDDSLKRTAEAIKEGCRTGDVVARVGGDEFVIILPNTDSLEAEKVIDCINKLAVKKKVGVLDISISFGCETKTTQRQNIEDIFKGAEDHMYRHKLYESASIKNKMIGLIMNTLYEKNPRELLHSNRVSEICEAIARNMHLSDDDVNQVKVAGLMHDIGKIGINEKILNSQDKLDAEEWSEIKRHPEISYRILSSCNEFSEIANTVLFHHERWDGKGYPKGLKEEEIPIQSRIIAIADAFDAMTSERSYKKVMSKQKAIEEIKSCVGKQFDPKIAKIFTENFVI